MREISLLAYVYGDVQAVGFRYYMRLKARELGIRGWVKNRADGSVESCICGEAIPMKAMQEWLHHGPAAAHVESVAFSPVVLTEALHDFSVRE